MHGKRSFRKEYLIAFLPAGIILAYIASLLPSTIEKYYSTGIDRLIVQVLSRSAGILPISLAEIGFVLTMILTMCWTIKLIGAVVIKRRMGYAGHLLVNGLIAVSIAYFLFIVLWGLNYYRLPFAEAAQIKVEPASTDYLTEVCRDLINRANQLRNQVHEDEYGVMQLSGGKEKVFINANKGYLAAEKIYPELGGSYGFPKSIIIKESMSYLGFSGVYCPFTGEPNVDAAVKDSDLPYTVCHEMAHQRGYAREDEANYISYLTCSMNPDPGFQYSGNLLALIQAMKMLGKYDPEGYKQLEKTYSDGLKRDLAASEHYWQDHEGRLWVLTNNVNDIYLKSNGQTDGVYSYNRMVDLLIAEHRAGIAHQGK